MSAVLVGWFLSLLGVAIAFHPSLQGSFWTWFAFGVCQLPVAEVAVRKLRADDELWERLRPRWGDISLGFGTALALLAFNWFSGRLVAPVDSIRYAWITRVYDQTGSSAVLEQRWFAVLAAVIVVVALVEIGWRGLIIPALEERVGSRKAWLVAGILYGLAFVPSVFWLRTEAGPNPVVVCAALVCGLVWSFMAARTQRFIPSMLSHAVFLWFAIVQFRSMGLP